MAFDLEDWDVERTVAFVQRGGYLRIALQLPDELLGPATQLVAELKKRLGASVTVRCELIGLWP
jgi:diphthamide biosynthesis enzyme Dph1/Dph2-like protein